MPAQERYNDTFPTRLRELIRERKTTITAVARELGVSRQAVSQYQDGSTQPDVSKLLKIAAYFGVSVDYLVGLSNVQSLDTDLQAVCKYTGLSEKAIENIARIKDGNIVWIEGIGYTKDEFFSADGLFQLISFIHNMCAYLGDHIHEGGFDLRNYDNMRLWRFESIDSFTKLIDKTFGVDKAEAMRENLLNGRED